MKISLLLSILILAGAFYPNHSYNYFVLLKWAVCGTSIWAAVHSHETKRNVALWIFVGSAIIHNPIMKFHFQRETWLWIDGITAVVFASFMYSDYTRQRLIGRNAKTDKT